MNKFEPNKMGVFENLPFDVYKNAPGVSKSMLDDFRDCPLKAWEKQQGLIKDEPTEAMIIGTLTDAAVFEPRSFKSKYYLHPATYPAEKGRLKPWNKGANYCKDWHRAHSDRPAISRSELDEIERMVEAVWKNHLAANLLRQCRFQVSLFAHHSKTGLMRKGRPDGLASRFILDLKKLADCRTHKLSRAIEQLHYYTQAAYYMDLANANGFDVVDFYFIAVEPSDRPKVNVRRLDLRSIALGRMEYERDLALFKECHETGIWPSYSNWPKGTGEESSDGIGEVGVSEGYETKIMGDMPLIGVEEA